ncbi:TetR/AcrR family transcriptional regulator [[Clostridium] innocuum]|nr:TetR/AcrR family transcriptional regulator [[Clostridium] innocuum]MCR0576175.1 TetR/AcrR family transcriptional regulator [[Clostridium] innocuum]
MARNKYPQRTVEKILEVSLALFNEKGYEKTTIQDIVNALGMSKGAIYHHFKSKDEIIEALSERCYHNDTQMELLRNASDKTGIEKLRAIIYRQIQNEEKQQIDTISINLWKNPKIFMSGMAENLSVNSQIVERILREGMADGSIRSQDPLCAAQVLMLLLNYWICSPIVLKELDAIPTKVAYFRTLCDSMGIPVIDDPLEQELTSYFRILAQSMHELP